MQVRNAKGQFIKGTGGGPGRPRLGLALADILRAIAEEEDSYTGETNLQILVRTLFEQAKAGDIPSIQIVLNRMFGREPEIFNIIAGQEPSLELLSDEELETYNALLEKTLDEPNQSNQT
jgi:hypothetical protein